MYGRFYNNDINASVITPNNMQLTIIFKTRNTSLKITLNAPQVGGLVAGRQQLEAGLDAR